MEAGVVILEAEVVGAQRDTPMQCEAVEARTLPAMTQQGSVLAMPVVCCMAACVIVMKLQQQLLPLPLLLARCPTNASSRGQERARPIRLPAPTPWSWQEGCVTARLQPGRPACLWSK